MSLLIERPDVDRLWTSFGHSGGNAMSLSTIVAPVDSPSGHVADVDVDRSTDAVLDLTARFFRHYGIRCCA